MSDASNPHPRSPREQLAALVHKRRQPHWRGVLLLLLVLGAWLAFRDPGTGEGITHLDKLLHLAAFATLTTVAGLSWPATPVRHFGVALGLLTYGVWIEWVQSGLPQRQADGLDVLADAIGIALGFIVLRWILAVAHAAPADRR
jgi:VanZ family protein